MKESREDRWKKAKRIGVQHKVAIVSITVVAILCLAVGVAFAVVPGSKSGVGGAGAAFQCNTSVGNQSGSCNASSTGVLPGNGAVPYNTDCQMKGAGTGHGHVPLPTAVAPAQ